MTKVDRHNEPARERAYLKLHDRIANQDSCITFLLIELRAVQKRLAKLEQHHADTASVKLRLACQDMDEVRGLEQRHDLRTGQAGDTEVGCPPGATGL